MTLTREQQKKFLIVSLAVLAVLIVYRIATHEKPKTAPLTYAQGAVAASAVRPGLRSQPVGADPLSFFLNRGEEKFPGVARDIFRTENPKPKPKPKPMPKLITVPTPTIPPAPIKTPEQIAEELARADLSKFRFLGSMTDQESSFFLSKDGESFIVKKGDTIQKGYKVKEADKDYVILFDTITRVEVRITLSGGEQGPQRSR